MGLFKFFNNSKELTPQSDGVEEISDSYSEIEQSDENNCTELPVRITTKEAGILATMQNYSDIVNRVASGYMECRRISANIEALRISTSADLKKHAREIQLCEKALMATFHERGMALNKHYQALDMALRDGDRQMILASLQGISSIVVKDPLESVSKLAMALRDTSKPLELDF